MAPILIELTQSICLPIKFRLFSPNIYWSTYQTYCIRSMCTLLCLIACNVFIIYLHQKYFFLKIARSSEFLTKFIRSHWRFFGQISLWSNKRSRTHDSSVTPSLKLLSNWFRINRKSSETKAVQIIVADEFYGIQAFITDHKQMMRWNFTGKQPENSWWFTIVFLHLTKHFYVINRLE